MLYLISLGLFDKEDISFKALEAIKKCDVAYIDTYTNYYNTGVKELSRFVKKEIKPLDREDIESDKIINEAKKKDVGLLVVGDVLSATTHISLIIEARKNKIKTKIVHGSSILMAIGETGLSLYKFGQATSIPFIDGEWSVEAPYKVLKENSEKDMHTLMLLDLRPKEGRYMTVNDAIKFLYDLEEKKGDNVFTEDTLCIGCAALGSDNSEIKFGKAEDLIKAKFKGFPQCLIVPAKMHFIEEEALNYYKI